MEVGIFSKAESALRIGGRRVLPGLAVLFLLAGPAAEARTAREPYLPSTAEGRWAALGEANGAAVYYRPTVSFSPAGFLLLVGRIEYRVPRSDGAVTYRSERALMEYDCLRRRERDLDRTVYPLNNLEGEAVHAQAASDWRSIDADAHARVAARAACKAP